MPPGVSRSGAATTPPLSSMLMFFRNLEYIVSYDPSNPGFSASKLKFLQYLSMESWKQKGISRPRYFSTGCQQHPLDSHSYCFIPMCLLYIYDFIL